MADVKDNLVDLEKHRLRLEENISSLRNALHHWRTWDAEYEGLKEEVTALSSTPSEDNLIAVRDAFEGDLIDKKEIDEIFGKSRFKSRLQIINLLDRRLDYVGKNISTLEKQLEGAENTYASTSELSQTEAASEDGEPITEIVEELDEEGNVIDFRLNTSGQSLPHVREALEKAGVDLDREANRGKSPGAKTTSEEPSLAVPKPGPPSTKTAKKNVSFADDTQPVDDSDPGPLSWNARRLQNVMKSARDQEKGQTISPIIPEDENTDDAALRQEMLKYGLGEMGQVGAVVAELNLEEGSTDEEDWDYSDEGYDDEDDGEDAHGRSTAPAVTEDYAQRMLELEKKLGIRSRFTEAEAVAAAESASDSDAEDGRIGRIVINHNPSFIAEDSTRPKKSSMKTHSKAKKDGVRFAENLDISPSEINNSTQLVTKPSEKTDEKVNPLSNVVERKMPEKTTITDTKRKPSRFKKALGNTTDSIPKGPMDVSPEFVEHTWQEAPSGPEGKTIADTLVEKPTSSRVEPLDDIFDDSSIYQEVADEHHKLRTKFIQRQGGFLKEDEAPEQRVDESGEGRERMSRFKAARLSQL